MDVCCGGVRGGVEGVSIGDQRLLNETSSQARLHVFAQRRVVQALEHLAALLHVHYAPASQRQINQAACRLAPVLAEILKTSVHNSVPAPPPYAKVCRARLLR
jgi:hypothetical protein